MPTLTIYTDPNQIGTCDVPAFVVGDDTTDWTLKFHDGTDYYTPAGVTMRVGHVHGLVDGTYTDAFRWHDMQNNVNLVTFTLTAGVVSAISYSLPGGLSGAEVGVAAPVHGVIGADGVYVFRGAHTTTVTQTYAAPYKSADLSVDVFSAVKMSPYLRLVRATGSSATIDRYPDSIVVIRPRVVADAVLVAPTPPATDWTGTMDPISDYVTAVLGIKRSISLDLEIFGDGRMLFKGTLPIFNRVA